MSKNITWAEKNSLTKNNFFDKNGFILGSYNNEILTNNNLMHKIIFAPNGSGKGVAHVIPNLLSCENSFIVFDIKGENYNLTKNFREKELKQKVFNLNLTGENNSFYYNPLEKIFNNKDNILDEINELLSILSPENNEIFKESKYLITAIILFLERSDNNRTFGEIFNILQKDNFEDFIKNATLTKNTNILNPIAKIYIENFLQKSEEERLKIKILAIDGLKLWSNPNIVKNTSKHSFNLLDFVKNKSTLYIVVEPIEIKKLQPLLNIIFSQLISYFICDKTIVDKKEDVAFLFDEFAELGKMDIILKMISYARGYKVKFIFITQNLEQLCNSYNEFEINHLLKNIPIKIFFQTSSSYTANLCSQLVGNKIFKNCLFSKNKIIKPLFLAEELINLPTDEEIIIFNDLKIKCNKFFYYKDETFLKRVE